MRQFGPRWFLAWRAEQRQRGREFHVRAVARVALISSAWPDLTLPIRAVQSVFNASANVSRDECSTFTQTDIDPNIGTGFFAWLPAVPDVAVAFHEAIDRADGAPVAVRTPGPSSKTARLRFRFDVFLNP